MRDQMPELTLIGLEMTPGHWVLVKMTREDQQNLLAAVSPERRLLDGKIPLIAYREIEP